MEEFLSQVRQFHILRQGDVVDGVVVSIDHDGIWVDIGGKSEGVVPPQEMQSLEGTEVAVGDEMTVYVIGGENKQGQLLLSADRAQEERGWQTLERSYNDGEAIEAEVVGFNKGGVIVDYSGVYGFVPSSQLMSNRNEALSEMLGRRVFLKVIELNRRRNRLILSERSALHDLQERRREKLLEELKEGETRKGRVVGIHSFGVFVDIGGVDGLVPIGELSWERVDDPHQIAKVGDKAEVYIIKVDAPQGRVLLSLRRAQPRQWQAVSGRYSVGQLVTGRVTKLSSFGAFCRIEGSAEGFVHISELSDQRITHPREVVGEGETITMKILGIDQRERRLRLSLKQAQGQKGFQE